MKEYLEVGMIRNVHGVKGDLTIECLCDTKEVFASLKTMYIEKKSGRRELVCTKNQPFNQNTMLVHFSGIDTREDAALLKGMSLYARRDDLPRLPDGVHYIADLIGLSVYDAESGRVYGRVSDVLNYGASDIYEIRSEDGSSYLMPAVDEFVREIDLEKGIAVSPIEGMFS